MRLVLLATTATLQNVRIPNSEFVRVVDVLYFAETKKNKNKINKIIMSSGPPKSRKSSPNKKIAAELIGSNV